MIAHLGACLALVLGTVATCVCATAEGSAGTQASAAPPIPALRNAGTIVILPFHSKVSDPEADHWGRGITTILREVLSANHALELMGSRDVDYAASKTGIGIGLPLSNAQARELGACLHATAVVWGNYSRPAGKWLLELHIDRMGGAGPSPTVTQVTGDNWLQLLRSAATNMIDGLAIQLSPEEWQCVADYWPKSEDSLAYRSKSAAAAQIHAPWTEVEAALRKAVELDSQFAQALVQLAGVLRDLDKGEEALAVLRQAMSIPKRVPHSYCLLAGLNMTLENGSAADAALEEAARQEPACSYGMHCLAIRQFESNRPSQALALLADARKLRPNESSFAAMEVTGHTLAGHVEPARKALEEAVRLARNDRYTYYVLIHASRLLNDAGQMFQHYRTYCSLAIKQRAPARELASVHKLFSGVEVNPDSLIHVPMPRQYSANELAAELKQRLSAQELALVQNPIQSSSALRLWAEDLTKGVSRPREKAVLLMLGLRMTSHDQQSLWRPRTALEVFADWNTRSNRFNCQDYSRLYVALAREVGLNAFYVHVRKDPEGKIIRHVCAVVYLPEGAMLVDPSMRVFGARHKDYLVLDDIQTVADHVSQLRNDGRDVERCRIALKLHDRPWGRLQLVYALGNASQVERAKAELNQIPLTTLNDNDRQHWFMAQGCLHHEGRDHEEAVKAFRQALELSPSDPLTHLRMGRALMESKDFNTAVTHFAKVLEAPESESTPENREEAIKALGFLKEVQGWQSGDTNSVAQLRALAEAGDPVAQYNFGIMLLKKKPPDTNCIAWLEKAAKGDVQAAHRLAWMYMYGTKGEMVPIDREKAMRLLTRAAEGGRTEAMLELGNFLYFGGFVDKNIPEAYKWLTLANERGNHEAGFVLWKLELFATPDELRQGKELVRVFKGNLEKATPSRGDKESP